MSEFRTLALVQAHAVIPSVMNYLISDLTELCALAASVRDVVDDITIPVGPTDRAPPKAFHSFMRKRRPQLVGISAYTCSVTSGLEYARIAKEFGAFVIMGGYHPSAMPEALLQSGVVDAVVRGEGEMTLRELVLNGPSREVTGLSFKEGSEILHNPERELIKDLDTLPLPLRELRPPRFGLDGLHYHVDSIYTSRGCTAKCAFCANHLVGKRWRKRSTESVIEELIDIAPAKGRRQKLVKLWDPSFMTHSARIVKLCDMIIDNGLHERFRFMAETRVEDIVRGGDALRKMSEAGFYHLGIGVESPNEETLKALNKGKNSGPAAVEQATQMVADSGMTLAKFFIIGHPNESVGDILDYAGYSVSPGVWKQSSHFFVLTPYPGTQTFEDYESKSWITNKNWDLYSNYAAVIKANGIPASTLQALSGTLAIQSSMIKRFSRGESFPKIIRKVLGLMLNSCTIIQTQTSWSSETQEDSAWQVLEHLRPTTERPIAGGRNFLGLTITGLRIFRSGRLPLTVSLENDGEYERISVVSRDEGERERRKGLTLNFSLAHVIHLARIFDARKSPHDAITLMFKPRAMKLNWVASLAGQAARFALVIAAMATFHVRKSLLR